MKTFITSLFLVLAVTSHAQVDESEFVSDTESFDLILTQSTTALGYFGGASIPSVPTLVTNLLNLGDPNLNRLLQPYHNEILAENDDYAVVIIYRKMSQEGILDTDASKTVIYHRSSSFNGGAISKYLLETSHVAFLFVDLEDLYYEDNESVEKLSNTKISMTYGVSLFRQSAKDLWTVLGAMGKATLPGKVYNVRMTWAEIDRKKIKAPCTVILKNKSFATDLEFKIHERNIATFQLGLVNTQLSVQDFKITGGTVIVSPDTAQQKAWKSNFFAAVEMHLPRDVDNFRPMWKELFYVDPDQRAVNSGRAMLGWLYRNTLNRVGVYGGLKLAKDPLSSLYAGFNYAVTKDLYINLGWSWNNEVVPQVTDVGSITSLDDIKEFLDRDYSKPTFSIGLSFSPSSVITMLGLKEKE
jgi:hypothetical protein